jgi:SAM-dependent methyltransferase
MEQPKALYEMAMPGVHAAARGLIEGLPRGTLVDLGAGNGALSLWAHKQGFRTIAVDANAGNFAAHDVEFVEADLNRQLPVADGSCDVAVSLEVIEHLENAYALVREMARVVKPGGYAILSTPNESNLHSRLSYFLTGFFADSSYVMRVPGPGDHYYPHVNCLPVPTLEYCWRRAGFQLVEFRASRLRVGACLLYPFMNLVQRLCYWTRPRKKKHADAATTDRVYQLMNDPRVQCGRILVFLLQKPAIEAAALPQRRAA